MKFLKTFVKKFIIKFYVKLILINCIMHSVIGLKCICNKQECDVISSQDCPGKGLIVWDPCRCCKVCAKTLGETCGGPGGFSGTCESPYFCISKPPVTGYGLCLELPLNSSFLECKEQILLEAGCEIVNRKCECWGQTNVCKDSLRVRFDFKNIKECELNLLNLVKSELEFDEDYTIPPTNLAYQKRRGKRRINQM